MGNNASESGFLDGALGIFDKIKDFAIDTAGDVSEFLNIDFNLDDDLSTQATSNYVSGTPIIQPSTQNGGSLGISESTLWLIAGVTGVVALTYIVTR